MSLQTIKTSPVEPSKDKKVITEDEDLLLRSFKIESCYVLFLLAVMLFSFFPFSLYGMSWSDTSQIFHFGNRMLNGEFPYRDFEYQTGFLGIYFDSISQRVFGQTYVVSLACRFAIKIGYIFCVYFICRKITNRFISTSFCCALSLFGIDGLGFAKAHIEGGNLNLAILFVMLFALSITANLRRDGESFSSLSTVAGGFFLALVLGARQSVGIVVIFVVLSVTTIYVLQEQKKYFRQLMIPLVGGITLGLFLQVAFLSINRSLVPALNSLFFEASSKKDIQVHRAIIEALTGGGNFSDPVSIVKTQLLPVFISLCLLGLIVYAARNVKYAELGRLGMALPLFSIALGTLAGESMFSYDIPRVFFSLLLLVCLLSRRSRDLVGLPYPIFPLLSSSLLGIVWAQQISWPGRPYTPVVPLLILSVLAASFSVKITSRWKRNLSLLFLFCMVELFSYHVLTQSIGTEKTAYKFYENARYEIESSMGKHIKVRPLKSKVFTMLKSNIEPGETCFISGSAAVLYTLLECENPTRLDITNADSLTEESVDDSLSILRVNPPKWIIDTGRFEGIGASSFKSAFNQPVVEKLQKGLGKLAEEYEIVETARDIAVNEDSLASHDREEAYRLFKLRA